VGGHFRRTPPGHPRQWHPADQAADHSRAFPFITLDITTPSAGTWQLLAWEHVHSGMIADREDGHYFTTG
jgi:hypothetical protein